MTFPFESLRELHEVTERRDDCVFRTRYVRDVWVGFGPDGEEQPPENHQFAPKSDPVEGSPRRRRAPLPAADPYQQMITDHFARSVKQKGAS